MHTDELVSTTRREAREGYCRYLLYRAGIDVADIEAVMGEKQAVLEDRSILEAIYGGDYPRAVDLIERFVDIFLEELGEEY